MSLLSHKFALLKQRQQEKVRSQIQSTFGSDGVELSLSYLYCGDVHSHQDVAFALQSQQSSHRFKALGQSFSKIHQVLLQFGVDSTHRPLRLSYPRYLQAITAFQDLGLNAMPAFWQWSQFTQIPGLNPAIKPFDYQRDGIQQMMQWLENGCGGILADDMGLGKTLQTLCAISIWLEQGNSGPILLLCPSSLCANWLTECRRFFPKLKALNLCGSDRSKLRWRAKQSQIVIMSYGCARLDETWLSAQTWAGLVLDEAHLIRNPQSILYKQLLAQAFPWRLALTGTPISNSSKEWYHLLNLIHPHQWGLAADFEKNMAYKAWRDAALKFMLRRRKEQVLTNLPPATEIELDVCLGSEQEKDYINLLKNKDQIFEVFRNQGWKASQFSFFALIHKLRQVCNQINQNDGKWPRLRELLHGQVRAHSKTLVFSQSLVVLDHLEIQLAKDEIAYLRLDGQTPTAKREFLVQKFQKSDQSLVFLLSTHAAGVGLNLTAANACVFLDSDWNPSWDAQARDRIYRIGQKSPVQIFRLVCRGTFEAKVLKRARQKTELAENCLNESVCYRQPQLEDLTDLLDYMEQNLGQ